MMVCNGEMVGGDEEEGMVEKEEAWWGEEGMVETKLLEYQFSSFPDELIMFVMTWISDLETPNIDNDPYKTS